MSDELISADEESRDPFDPLTQQVAQENIKTKRDLDMKAARNELETRRGAYHRVFVEGTPSKDDREIVLKDLARFCRYDWTAFSPDERVHCLLSGRQEVYLRVKDFTSRTVDELVERYTANIGEKGV